jgi:two-component system chemotaxis response regulator CheB
MNSDPRRDIVVIGGSAGGIEALTRLAAAFPKGLPAAVLVVIHTSRDGPSFLAELLGRAGRLPARFARDRDPIRASEMLIAPPDMHMLVEGREVRVTQGPRENGFRPAIDPLFRTAARTYGPRVAGVILSGALDDGTHGLLEVKHHGGLALVQHVEEAALASMPLSALRMVEVDHVLRLDELARKIADSAGHGAARTPLPSADRRPDPAKGGAHALTDGSLTGPPSGFTCPQCGGALWEMRDGRALGFRCHVGHRFGESSVVAFQAQEVEDALWTAVRTLEEAVALRRRMADYAIETGLEGLAQAYLDGAKSAQLKAGQIRQVLTQPGLSRADVEEEAALAGERS